MQKREGKKQPYRKLRRAFREGRVEELLSRYLAACGTLPAFLGGAAEEGALEEREEGRSGEMKRRSGSVSRRLPNPAGFCRFYGLAREDYERLRIEFPAEIGYLGAVFEDEALNGGLSATLLSFYLKYLLCGVREEEESEKGKGQIEVIFAHDILQDGR